MSRFVLACLIAAAALLAPEPNATAAPIYATQELRQMSVVDRIRAIEQAYREQNGGRQIPDDQLEYYLDRVNNDGWTWAQVRQDMAVARGGNYGGWRPGQDWQAREVVCTSDSNRYRECPTPFYGHAVITQQLSKKSCREGITWGQRQGMVWVNKGCRARFGEDASSYWGQGSGRRATCESKDGRYRECPVNFTGRAQVSRQLSSSACIYNRDWGQRFGMIWVSNGCRAEFIDGGGQWGGINPGNMYGGSGQKITCASHGSRYTECRTTFTGTAQLTRQLSSSSCIVNRDWGQRGSVIWVSNGCRAEFTDVGGGQWNNDGNSYGGAYSISCASEDGQFVTCGWDRNRGQPQLLRQDSDTRCVEGSTWGYDYNGGVVWVNRGCRGRFGVR
jgi:hypothetical protein